MFKIATDGDGHTYLVDPRYYGVWLAADDRINEGTDTSEDWKNFDAHSIQIDGPLCQYIFNGSIRLNKKEIKIPWE
jgi:hypothetical protein